MSHSFPNGYALLVGVGDCAYPPWSLPATVSDVRAIHAALTDNALCAFGNDDLHVRLLHDYLATRGAILDGLAWLKARADADSQATAVVYYSGHGWLDQASGRYYLIPHDVKPFDVAASALSAEDFTDALRAVRARQLLVVIDSCHAEGMATSKRTAAPLALPAGLAQAAPPKAVVEGLKRGEGRAVFTSSRGNQLSWVCTDGSLSIYTHHLLEALHGAGNRPGDTEVRVSNLINHLSQAVPTSARAMYNADQVPFFDTAMEDFAVALLRGGKGLPSSGWQEVEPEAAESIRQVVDKIHRSVIVGGSVSGSTIITGNENRVQRTSSAKRTDN